MLKGYRSKRELTFELQSLKFKTWESPGQVNKGE